MLTRAKEWEREAKDSSFLLRGKDLREAERWVAKSSEKDPKPTVLQSQYILASRQSAIKLQRIIVGAVAIAFLIAVGLAVYALLEAAVAKRNARESRARELAAFSTETLSEDPQKSIFLGLEALSATVGSGDLPMPSAEEALHQAMLSLERPTLRGHSGSVNSLAWSPNGKLLVTGSSDGTAKVWDMGVGKELRTLCGHCGTVTSVAFSPDGKKVATVDGDGATKVWDTETGNALVRFARHDSVNCVSWSPKGKLFAVGAKSGATTVWDAETGKVSLPFQSERYPVLSVAWSPDGKHFATGGESGTTTVWDADTGKPLTLPSYGYPVLSVAWSPDGKRLATGSSDWTATVWDAGSPTKLQTLEGHLGDVLGVAWSGDGKWLATASRDQTTKVWDPETGKELLSLSDHRGSVRTVAWSPDGKLATGGEDGTVKVWDSRSKCSLGTELLTLRGHRGGVVSVAWGPGGSKIATGSWDGTAKVWDAKTGNEKKLPTLDGHSGQVGSVAWSPDGKRLVTSGQDRIATDPIAIVWDADTGEVLHALSLPHDDAASVAWSVAWSPTDKRLALGSADGAVEVWDADTGKRLQPLGRHDQQSTKSFGTGDCQYIHGQEHINEHNVNELAWYKDGKHLATASWDGTAKVWGLETGKVQTLSGHCGPVYRVAWSPDGKRLVTGGWDGTARVWGILRQARCCTL